MKVKFYRIIAESKILPSMWFLLILTLITAIVSCLTGCTTRKLDDGIYRVKSGGRWYVTDSPKEIKEIK